MGAENIDFPPRDIRRRYVDVIARRAAPPELSVNLAWGQPVVDGGFISDVGYFLVPTQSSSI